MLVTLMPGMACEMASPLKNSSSVSHLRLWTNSRSSQPLRPPPKLVNPIRLKIRNSCGELMRLEEASSMGGPNLDHSRLRRTLISVPGHPGRLPRGQEPISATVIKRPIWSLVTPNQPSSRKLYHDVALLGRCMRRLILWWRKHSSECVREPAGFRDVDPTATVERFCLSAEAVLELALAALPKRPMGETL